MNEIQLKDTKDKTKKLEDQKSQVQTKIITEN